MRTLSRHGIRNGGTDRDGAITVQGRPLVSTSDAGATTLAGEGILTRRLLASIPPLERGELVIHCPRGARLALKGGAAGPVAHLYLHRPLALLGSLRKGAVGLGESYMAGSWDSPDLSTLLELLVRNETALVGELRAPLPARLCHRALHALRHNSRAGSRRNIRAHYDLGNAFYATWLDPGMSYSAACFDGPDCDLERAQTLKNRRVLDLLRPQAGQALLEIGCGWGQFAIQAARETGCRVRAVTVSRAQHELASARVQASGLGERVSIELCDYRDLAGRYDHVVSIEMFEAVGERYWPVFFERLSAYLKPEARAVMQVIRIDDARFEHYRRHVDFIQRYIFPGGMLPSPRALEAQARAAGLVLEPIDPQASRLPEPDYARTLSLWLRRFDAARESVHALGLADRFVRMWRFYLAYCEAGFRSGRIDVRQSVLARS